MLVKTYDYSHKKSLTPSVHDTQGSNFVVCMTLWSQNLLCTKHCGLRLCSVHDTQKSNSVVYTVHDTQE